MTGGGRPPADDRRNWLVILVAILAGLVVAGSVLVALARGTFF